MRDWIFCPRCGNELTHKGPADNPHVLCGGCQFVKYDNPLPTTIGVVRTGDRYLFLRRAHEPHKGRWDTVGGFLVPGERAEACLVREAREEIGCLIENMRLIGTYASTYGSTGLRTLGIAFVCDLPEGSEIVLSDENDMYRWFPRNEIPELAFGDVRQAVRQATMLP